LRDITSPNPTKKQFDQNVLELFPRLLLIFKTSSNPLFPYTSH